MTKNPAVAIAVVVGLAGLAACDREPRYPGTFQGVVELDERLLGFEVGGRITELAVRRGADLQAGDLIARVDDTLAITARAGREAEADVARARARLVQSGARVEDIRVVEAQLEAARSTEALVQKNLARDRQLVDQGALARAALDETEVRARTARAEIQVLQQHLRELRSGSRSEEKIGADAQAAAAEVAVRLEAERAARYQLRALAGGTVLDVHVEPGEIVGPGAPVVTVADLTRPYVDVFLPQADLAGVDVGDRAAVHVDALVEPVAGVVEDIGRRTEFTPRYVFSERERATLVVRVRIRIDDRARRLHAGVPAFVSIDRGAATTTAPATGSGARS